MSKMTFALYFGNRGFMPAELIEGAREDMIKAVTDAGYDYIIMDKSANVTERLKPVTKAERTRNG